MCDKRDGQTVTGGTHRPGLQVFFAQRVQNTAARLIMGLPPSDHVSSVLKELHWLPVPYHIQFKLALLMFKANVC